MSLPDWPNPAPALLPIAATCWLAGLVLTLIPVRLLLALLDKTDLAEAAKPGSALVMLTDSPVELVSNRSETCPNSEWVTEA